MKQKTPKFTKKEETILNTWKHTNHLRETTFKTYKSMIHQYTQATGLTLTQLHEEALNEEENHTPRYRKSIKTHIIEYKEYLDQHQYSESTKNTCIFVVTSWYKSLDIDLPLIQNHYDTTPTNKNHDKLLTKPLIQKMINQATTRDKAILSFAATTGQGQAEISNLKIQDIVDSWNTMLPEKIFTLPDIFKYKNQILQLEAPALVITRQKTRTHYWIYLAPETTRYIVEYLYERVAGQNSNTRITSFDAPLFVTHQGEKMQAGSIGKIFTYIGKRCGFEIPELFDNETRLLLERGPKDQRIYSCHKYRKYFLNMCRRHAGTNTETRSNHVYTGSELGDFWIGHQEKGSISHYLQYNDEDVQELREHYLQMLPYLSLEMEVNVVTSRDKKEFEKMKEKYESLVDEMEMLKEYVREKQKVSELAKLYGLE